MTALQKVLVGLFSVLMPMAFYIGITGVAAIPGVLLSAFVPCIGADIGFFEMVVFAPMVGFIWMASAEPLGSNRFLGAMLGVAVYMRTLFGSIEHIPVSPTNCKRLVWPMEGKDCRDGDCYLDDREDWESTTEYHYEYEESWEDPYDSSSDEWPR
ncbi:MAG: hypothetical protein KTR25_19020 [Myxococcales bacterium]|nr:hypothetical protein [Myxococcales bacterium]